MSKSSHHIETSLHKLQRLGSVLSAVFAALTVATVVLAVALAINVGAHVGRDARVTSFGVIEGAGLSVYILPAVAWLAIALVLEVTLWSICRDMKHGESPFTVKHVRLIALLGAAFVFNAVMGVFFPGTMRIGHEILLFTYVPNAMMLGIALGHGLSLMLDVGSLLTALVCFATSAMWRYAALLQAQSDDLV
ncbi:hypothetical protein B5G20_03710 [Collinsella sp. An7]|uniref:hypothetical protein n=1 Tax=Collinsella sp. An7 TaxID=1965651 RepID=UPI000B3AC26C|nr:hypothetical protein [Collinsella sp. An7]OUN47825.1 hypothetical protein B5G20_03710 [Collinsella sp. An7]